MTLIIRRVHLKLFISRNKHCFALACFLTWCVYFCCIPPYPWSAVARKAPRHGKKGSLFEVDPEGDELCAYAFKVRESVLVVVVGRKDYGGDNLVYVCRGECR